jgi:hypothetical protein
MKTIQFRQGDVFIEMISELPKKLKKKEDNVVAIGESMNHAHAIFGKAEVLTDDSGELYLSVDEETQLKHILLENGVATERWTEEHKEISLKPGRYKVTIQQQYNPYEKMIEKVKD